MPAGAVAEIVLACDGDTITAVSAGPPMAAVPNVGHRPLADGVDRFSVWFTDFAPPETLHRFAEVITAVTTSPAK